MKSSNTEKARRINAALGLLKREESVSKAAKVLASQYGMSRSQSYRYVREAMREGKEVSVPGPKLAFTVKLPQKLIDEVRQTAQVTGQSISNLVALALEAFLHKDSEGGQKRRKRQTGRDRT